MNVLQPPRTEILPYFERLMDEYKTYCLTVSRRGMALSIETSAYIWWLCDFKEARTVVDLGSGFSSYVLRLYASTVDHDVVVHSVDSSPDWLARSEAFCASHGVSSDGFLTGRQWLTLDTRYDVAVNDYDRGETRERFAEHAADRLAPAGAIVFDDANHADHHDHMARTCIGRRLALLDLYHQTRDEVGRYAMVGARS